MSFVRERMRMDGRVAVVTGGGQGIGRAIALGMADAGARVVVGEINEETGPRTASEIAELGGEAHWIRTDVRRPEEIRALVEGAQAQFGRIDAMFNNAGGNFQLPALEISEGGFDAIVRMNLKSMFLGSQAAARMMLEEGHGGSIVSTASVARLRSSSIGVAVYSAAKAGIMGMTRGPGERVGRAPHPRQRGGAWGRGLGRPAQEHAGRPCGASGRRRPAWQARSARGYRRGRGVPRLGSCRPHHRADARRGRRREHLLTS